MTLGADPRRGPGREQVASTRSPAGRPPRAARGGRPRAGPRRRYVAHAGGQLDEPLLGRVAVLRADRAPAPRRRPPAPSPRRDARRRAGGTASASCPGGSPCPTRSATTQSSRCRSSLGRDRPGLGGVVSSTGMTRRYRPGSLVLVVERRSPPRRSGTAAPADARSPRRPDPANSGCGRVGRERSSGWAWVAT